MTHDGERSQGKGHSLHVESLQYVVNPYTGCEHACTYCYARFMKRFSGHKEPWGEFVDVKINACDLLPKELGRKRKGRVWMSGVCDPYQPLEARYELEPEMPGNPGARGLAGDRADTLPARSQGLGDPEESEGF